MRRDSTLPLGFRVEAAVHNDLLKTTCAFLSNIEQATEMAHSRVSWRSQRSPPTGLRTAP